MQCSRYIPTLILWLAFSLPLYAQNVGIGTNTPNSSAMLDVVSTNKGVLIPRVETSAITTPVAGLIIYQPSDNSFYYHNGTEWQKLSGGGIVDSDGDTRVTALNATGSIDSILFEIDNQKKLVLKRNPGGDLTMEPLGFSLNSFYGLDAGQSITSGSFNSGIGANALKSNQHGNFNTGIGYDALSTNTSGAMNTALGASVLSQNTYGNFNTASGVSALQMNITGSYNVAAGHNALTTNSEGTSNTGIGAAALKSNTLGSGNVAAGYRALFASTLAHGNVAIGRETLAKTTTRENLVAVGDSALHYNQEGWITLEDGSQNTAVGGKAMLKNTIGKWNSAFGYQAMKANTSGVNNVALGSEALLKNTTGSGNTAMGSGALWSMLAGVGNTAVGGGAIGFNQSGSNNVGLGWRAGFTNTTGTHNVFIGPESGYYETGSQKLYIENTGTNADSALIYGEFDNDLVRVNANMEVNIYDPYETGINSIIKAPSGTLSDAPALYGQNTVDDYYGVGVHGRGGYYGVFGEAPGTSTGNYTGVRGVASGISGATTFGVYGEGIGGTTNYGGYFVGNGFFSEALGIGTLSLPTEKLQIVSGDDPTILIQSDGVDEMSGKLSMRQSNFTGVDVFYDGHSSADAIVFETFTSGASNGRKMTIDLDGNVGINITENVAAGHKLSVNGKIACTEVRVQPQSAWPDYVFASDYNLMSLDELQSSIEKNNHLPGIPSADQIASDGLQLGEMQTRMMEKIEELTLYILQLNTEIVQLKQLHAEQEKMISKLSKNQ